MEKQKDKVAPKETPEQRPELYVMMASASLSSERLPMNGVWLKKGSGKVSIKDDMVCPFGTYTEECPPGTFKPGHPTGPAYAGPIDDEMMANILIYG